MDQNTTPLPPYESVERNIVVAILLTIITFGIYYLFWQAHQMRCWNKLLGRDKYNFWLWFLLTICTFGLYHIYHEWVMGSDMMEIQQKYGKPVNSGLPIVSVLLAVIGIPFVADAIQHNELHRLY